MKEVKRIKGKLETLQTRWNAEKKENAEALEAAERKLADAKAEKETAGDPSEFSYYVKKSEEASNEVDFYRMKAKNFKHQLNPIEAADYRKTLEKLRLETIQAERPKIEEAYQKLCSLIDTLDEDLREINETQNLLAALTGQNARNNIYMFSSEDICGTPAGESMYKDFADFARYYIGRKTAKLMLRGQKLIN